MAEDAGRDPESFDFGQFGTPPKAEVVDTLIEAGCNRVVFTLPPADADTVIPKLDQISEFKDQYKEIGSGYYPTATNSGFTARPAAIELTSPSGTQIER